uniref:Probable nucleoporin Nup58 n=2 Tax=Cacopsylla melanoneura TaxID=428564 RepID=A0A8D8UP91_9HEMI
MRSIEHCAMAQRTQNMPSSLQSENTAPSQYFLSLSEQFESELLKLRSNVELTQKLVGGFTQTACTAPSDLYQTMKRVHDAVVSVAGNLQSAQSEVQCIKDKHLQLRQTYLKDTTNIFDMDKGERDSRPRDVEGPSPFGAMGNFYTASLALDRPALFASAANSSGWVEPSQSASANESTIQLSLNPPPGTKRGKRW